MVNSFDDFILESYLAESVLYFSPRLRSQLKSLSDDSEIAKELLDKEKKDIKHDITLVDLDETDFGYFTFIPMKNAIKKLNDYYPKANNKDIQNKVDTRATDFLWINRNEPDVAPVYRKGRNSIKAGKLVKKLFRKTYNPNDIEEFTNLLRSKKIDSSEQIKLVSGDDIAYWYDSSNYYEIKGTLGSSCMKYNKKETFNIYVENKENVQLLTLLKFGKLVGRALVWKLNSIKTPENINPVYYMDRVYTTNDYYLNKFINYAKEKGWCYRKYNSVSLKNVIVFKDKNYSNVEMTVKVKPKNYIKYPYMDTFSRYNERKGLLYNDDDKSLGGHILQDLHGGYIRSIPMGRVIINRFRDFLRSD